MTPHRSYTPPSRYLDRIRLIRNRLWFFCKAPQGILFATCASLPFNGIIALKRVLLLLLVARAIQTLCQNGRWPQLPAAVWGWFALAPLSLAWSVAPRLSANELMPDALYPLLGLLAAITLSSDWSRLQSALSGLFAGGVVVISVGLFQALCQDVYDWQTLAHGVGQFSTYLVMLLPFATLGTLEAWRKKQRIQFAILFVFLAMIMLAGYTTFNRMFWLSSLAVLTVICAGALSRQEYAEMRKNILIGVISIALTVAGVFFHMAQRRTANVIRDNADTSITSTFANSERFEMWRFWIERVYDHPLLGIGFGYDLPMLTYRSLKPAHWFDLMFAHAHNLFIDVTLRLGLVGLVLFIAAIITISIFFWRAVREADFHRSLAGISGLALLAGILSKNLTDDFLTRGPLLSLWVLLGILLGFLQRTEKP